MMIFWSSVVCISVVTAWLVLRPGSRPDVLKDNEKLRISVFRENLQELESELATGDLDSNQLKNVKSELELTLLQETGSGMDGQTSPSLSSDDASRKFLLMITTGLVCLSIVLYFFLGSPQVIKMSDMAGESIYSQESDGYQPSPEMAGLMEQHLLRNPEDVNGLYFLASNYIGLADYESAADVFERLYQITGDNPQVLVNYVDVLVRLNNGSFIGRPTELIERAVMLAPDNYSVLLFAGLAADESGNYAKANGYYKRLLPVLEGNPQLLNTINTLIANTEIMMQSEESEASGSTAEVMEPGPSVRVSVSIAEDFINEIDQTDTLFVYAQAIDGSPMPLAIFRTQAGELPMDVTLDDSLSMMPTYKISSFENVRIQARISKSGSAEVSSGDLVGVIENAVVAGSDTLALVIDEKIP